MMDLVKLSWDIIVFEQTQLRLMFVLRYVVMELLWGMLMLATMETLMM